MQAIAYKNGGLTGNWCALMLCIFNAEYTSDKALKEFGVSYQKRVNCVVRNSFNDVNGNAMNIQEVRKDYEEGYTFLELTKKYHASYEKIRNCIIAAGGRPRNKGGEGFGEQSRRKTNSERYGV